jgi:hypothetical protein
LIDLATVTSGYNFIFLGLAFGIAGLMNNLRLKKYFNTFYQENKVMLIFAAIGLSVPLMIRGSLDLYRHYDPKFEDLISENITLYDSLLFLVGDVIPISFQLNGLIFGYIRRKKDQRMKLCVDQRGQSYMSVPGSAREESTYSLFTD